MDNDVKLGKFISLILRHKPETIDLKLDENGWADTKELIEKISKSGREIDFTTLERIVNENNKKRYSFNEDKTISLFIIFINYSFQYFKINFSSRFTNFFY